MTKAAYNKAALTYQQQLEQLKECGLNIPDKNYLLHLLEVKSSCRLSGYWRLLLEDKKNHRFKERHERLLDKLEQEYLHSDEEFILAFREKYTNPMPPAWMMLEVTSLGLLSVMYRKLKPGREKRGIAGAFGLADKVCSSWLHSIVYLRNVYVQK